MHQRNRSLMEEIIDIKAWSSPRKYLGLPGDFMNAKKGSRPSWTWSSLLEGRDFIKSQGRWLIASGRGSRKWDLHKVNQLLPAHKILEVLETPVCWEADSDIFYWPHDHSGSYSVRTGYHVAKSIQICRGRKQSSSSYQVDPEVWKWIWNAKNQKLQSTSSLDVAGPPLFGSALSYSGLLMFPLMFGLRIGCWKESGNPQSPENHPPTNQPSTSFWRPPPIGLMKINVDAAWDPVQKTGASAVVIRDSLGSLLAGSTSPIRASSPQMAEALAAREGIVLAMNLQLPKILLESNCKNLISALRKEKDIGEIKGIIGDIFSYLSRFESSGFLWAPRSSNLLPHSIAKLAQNESLPRFWMSQPHAQIKIILLRDVRSAIFETEERNRFLASS
ncbi:Ribonuclease H-like superfamily [Sesbania bispinosa]|nr:Ribonuclease H-like superfamily [Sesbania bispinosa]